MRIPSKCDVCGSDTPQIELHVCERGWLCDGCYYSNEPWVEQNDEYEPGGLEDIR